ncbi:EGF-like repeat and discoidin I-like domain-containing protein 3 [Branchiostoma floridae]|uniref:EGF-like repeat and discoidin I-like domain-containing protein 3 n=1 Tax=Branchiostoma floridae TaxID=7739 RepID=A0A9J7MVB5_BRAFL|nr:EGF-like repeat and discoidin I-like domain-containing protein 3 [Branchiostoma floridae]
MRPLLTIILQILLKAGLFLGVGSSDCSSPLGMESGAIRDSQISASSSFNAYRNPRLNGNSEWRADVINQNQWLQVDLQNRAMVSGIQTQGRRTDTARFVTSFTVSYSDDGTNWTVFTEGAHEAKVFIGNNDSFNIQDNTLDPPIIARYIRVNPRTWNRCGYQRCITMRIELLGCDLNGATTEPTDLSTTVSSHIKGYNMRTLPENMSIGLYIIVTERTGVRVY